MRPTFVLFSGLPGTGKSALAERLATDLKWPLLKIDDMAACLPAEMDRNTTAFWDQAIAGLLLLTEAQLKLGVSVIADSIFMNFDRYHAQAIARNWGARFLPIHTFVSNEATWKERVDARYLKSKQGSGAASWSEVLAQQEGYRAWEAGTALFVDTIQPLDESYRLVKACVTNPDLMLIPPGEGNFIPGKYHD
jgi:predicted kinase